MPEGQIRWVVGLRLIMVLLCAAAGGSSGYGVTFGMTLAGVFCTLHSFGGLDGAQPSTRLIQANEGHLYGVTTRRAK